MIQIYVTTRKCSFFPLHREEREEEEQQKLKEQHDIPTGNLQSPGKTVGRGNGGSNLQTSQAVYSLWLGELLAAWTLFWKGIFLEVILNLLETLFSLFYKLLGKILFAFYQARVQEVRFRAFSEISA